MQAQSLKTRFLLITLLFFLAFTITAGIWLYFEVRSMIRELGKRYAVERVETARLRITGVLGREAALAVNLARSPVIQNWILDEEDKQKQTRAFEELAGYRESFTDSNSFVGILSSRHYYNWGADGTLVRSTLKPEVPTDQWFFQTVDAGSEVSFNLDYNVNVKVSRVWINCLVKRGADKIGLAGTGIDITDMVSKLVSSEEDGTSEMLTDAEGVILAHRDSKIMEKNARADSTEGKITVFTLAKTEADREQLRTLMQSALAGHTPVAYLNLEGRTGLTAMTYIRDLDALVVASLDTSAFLAFRDFAPVFILLAVTIILGLIMTTVFLQRLVLRPLAALSASAQKISEGRYDSVLPVTGRDEISSLSMTFNMMAEKIRDYTHNLERKVKERTLQLSQSNERLESANNRMTQNIRYAGMIQKGTMPDEKMLSERFSDHSLFFRQRDIVGGDLLYLRDIDSGDPGAGFFLAAVDCEGHGVSGALMTMMTDSVLEHVIPQHDPRDPAAVLAGLEKEIGNILSGGYRQDAVQSGFDIGLCACFPRDDKLVFAGAGMPLYVRDSGGAVSVIPGRRKAIRNRYHGMTKDFENRELSLHGNTFFLVTDGFVDQSGGLDERSYGTTRLYTFFENYHHNTADFEKEFDAFRGETAQRDDVLAVAFSLH